MVIKAGQVDVEPAGDDLFHPDTVLVRQLRAEVWVSVGTGAQLARGGGLGMAPSASLERCRIAYIPQGSQSRGETKNGGRFRDLSIATNTWKELNVTEVDVQFTVYARLPDV